jgi:hypothetical protein
MRRMSTDPNTPDETVPPAAASDSGDTADAAASPLPEQIYDQTYDEAILGCVKDRGQVLGVDHAAAVTAVR